MPRKYLLLLAVPALVSSCLGMSLLFAAAAQPPVPPTPTPAPVVVEPPKPQLVLPDAETLERLVNDERTKAGLAPLIDSPQLDSAACGKADHLLAENYWAHVSPSGVTPWHWFEQAGYVYSYAGENLARDFSSADSAVYAWMNSPTHRENILGNYIEQGLCVRSREQTNGPTVIMIVNHFGVRG